MWFDEAGEVAELFKTSWPLSFLFLVPIFILISPVCPASAAHEFSVYRMQQFDLHGTQYGSRSSVVSLDARHIDAKVLARRCVVSRLKELSLEKFKDLINQGAGALVILLPPPDYELSKEEQTHLMNLESSLLGEEIPIPVYFTYENPKLSQIYKDVQDGVNSDQAASATEALFTTAAANGFQFVSNSGASRAKSDFKVTNIQGKLSGFGIEEQLPTIAIVAHYDSFGIAPALAEGGDSNGSGVVAVLELARLFSKLYTNARTHARYNFLFLLSGGGKFNYQGTKKWIEEALDNMDTSLLSDVSFVLCLDSIGKTDDLFLQVSKPPKEKSAGDVFYKQIKEIVTEFHKEVKLSMNHKKINLASDMLAWEHERFSFRRLPAFTLTHIEDHKELSRTSITDKRSKVDTQKLVRNIKIVAEARARHIYNLNGTGAVEVFGDALDVQFDIVDSWLNQLSSQSRAQQMLHSNHPLLATLEQGFSRYLKDVKRQNVKSDKRDPEFTFYDAEQSIMSAYSVKPAIFDLFLAILIAAYLYVVYLMIQHFDFAHSFIRSIISHKVKSH